MENKKLASVVGGIAAIGAAIAGFFGQIQPLIDMVTGGGDKEPAQVINNTIDKHINATSQGGDQNINSNGNISF